MSCKFKIGDQVILLWLRCPENEPEMTVGKTYRVTDISENSNPAAGYNPTRHILWIGHGQAAFDNRFALVKDFTDLERIIWNLPSDKKQA